MDFENLGNGFGWTKRMERFGPQDGKSSPFAKMMSTGEWAGLWGNGKRYRCWGG